MQVETTKIEAVKIFTPKLFNDNRGYFTETFTANKFDPHAPGLDFVQDNESFSKPQFTIRGLHYQAPPFAQDKLVRVIRGSVFDVAVDVRKGSPTFGQWVGVTLSSENRQQLLVPKGFLHGFLTLEPETLVAYKVTAFYDGASDGSVHFASPDLAIDWPAPADKIVISDKDRDADSYADFDSPFDY